LIGSHNKKEEEHKESTKRVVALEQELKNKIQELLQHQTDLAERQDAIDRLNLEIKDLNAAHAAALAALQEQIDKLKAAAPAPAAPHDDTALLDSKAQIHTLTDELNNCKKNKKALQRDINDLRQQISAMTRELKNTVVKNQKGLTDLKQTISRNTQRQISKSALMELLLAKKYTAIRDAVKGRAALPRTSYSTPAVFLHLESMVATWKMYLLNEASPGAKPQASQEEKEKVMDRHHLVLGQMLYDLTMWFSMLNDVKTRYCLKGGWSPP
jgi:predicted  nucleic acid-binding Zn-ribbon protein